MTNSRRWQRSGKAQGTALNLVSPFRYDHTLASPRILPKAMAELVEQGLFVPDPDAESGYRITPLGRKLLKEFDQ